MKKLKITILTSVFTILLCGKASAQDITYQEAEKAYNMGHFEMVDSLLAPTASKMYGDDRVKAYRLMALSCIYLDDIAGAEDNIRNILAADPYYSPYGETPRFTDIVNKVKKGSSATLTTASQQAETIEEAPVPVTIITEEMMHNIGARNLKDVLLAYVPGMTDVANNEELNVAMRGIYSSGQEKILILLNGHRLNSYSTNVAAPDYSISLNKVKQIEVLRGPASSIYGGAALTGVVNLITKDGNDVDGLDVKAAVGNYGQIQGDILFGKNYMDINFTAWLSLYKSDGQRIHLDENHQPYATMPIDGDIIIGGFNGQPSYDAGFNLKSNNLSIIFSRRLSKVVAPYSLSFFFAPYSYDKYRKWFGNAPGYAITSDNAEVSYGSKAGAFNWQVKLVYDHQDQQRYQVGGDYIPDVGFNDVKLNGVEDVVVKLENGCFQSVNWRETTVGGKFQGGFDYNIGASQSGNITFGLDAGNFSLLDATYMEGIDYDLVIKTYNDEKILNTGKELSADAYLQIKHKIADRFIINAGMRYDYKKRRNGMIINDFSPRMAFIYTHPKFDLKLSYAKSFVDAPYFYRNNTLDINFGDESMKPEYLNSVQFSFLSDRKLVNGLFAEANLFYNKATNFIVANELGNINAGMVSSTGAELVCRYTAGIFNAEGNFTWQKVLSADQYDVDLASGRFYNIPQVQGNIVLSVVPGKRFSAHTDLRFTGSQSSLFVSPGADPLVIDIPSRCIVGAGASLDLRRVVLEFNLYNAFNKEYIQGGSSVAPIQQPGLWLLGGLSFKI